MKFHWNPTLLSDFHPFSELIYQQATTDTGFSFVGLTVPLFACSSLTCLSKLLFKLHSESQIVMVTHTVV